MMSLWKNYSTISDRTAWLIVIVSSVILLFFHSGGLLSFTNVEIAETDVRTKRNVELDPIEGDVQDGTVGASLIRIGRKILSESESFADGKRIPMKVLNKDYEAAKQKFYAPPEVPVLEAGASGNSTVNVTGAEGGNSTVAGSEGGNSTSGGAEGGSSGGENSTAEGSVGGNNSTTGGDMSSSGDSGGGSRGDKEGGSQGDNSPPKISESASPNGTAGSDT